MDSAPLRSTGVSTALSTTVEDEARRQGAPRRSRTRPAELAVRRWAPLTTALGGVVLALASAGCTSAAVSTAPRATPTAASAGSQVTGSVPPPATPAAGRVFTTRELTFRYDRSWIPSTWSVVSTAASSIVYLSPQPTHDPCITTSLAGGGERVDCTSPVTTLTPGGVLIDWYYCGLPGNSLRSSPGHAVTVAGHPARLESATADPACARLRGTRSVDAVIDPQSPAGSPSLLHMDACLTRTAQTAPVLAMLQSLQLTAPTALTAPARFPPVATDDPCQPLRHDPELRQPEGTGPLPPSATITAARWCVASPGTHGDQLQRYQSTGNVSALNRALHAPLTAAASANTVCPAGPPQFPVSVEVLDQHGNLSRPTLPIDSCGAISGTRDALSATLSTPLTSN